MVVRLERKDAAAIAPALTDRLFVPASLARLFTDMPDVSAPVEVRVFWLQGTRQKLRALYLSDHGLEAFRLVKVVTGELNAAQAELAAKWAV